MADESIYFANSIKISKFRSLLILQLLNVNACHASRQKANPYDYQISRQVVDCPTLNLSVLGFSFVFHDKAKRTQQENLLAGKRPIPMITRFGNRLVAPPHPGSSANSANWITFEFLPSAVTRSIFFLFHLTSFPGVIYPEQRDDSGRPYNGQLWWGWDACVWPKDSGEAVVSRKNRSTTYLHSCRSGSWSSLLHYITLQ